MLTIKNVDIFFSMVTHNSQQILNFTVLFAPKCMKWESSNFKSVHMEALSYEGLIRDVFKTKRTLENGADADIYRAMEHAHNGLSITEMNGTQSQREYEFQSKFAPVRRNIREAISAGIQELGSRGSTEDITSLEAMKNTLDMRFYDKIALDKIIRDAHDIFENYGMTKRS